jgi:glutathione S-transferase
MKNLPKFRLYGLRSYDRSAKARWLLTEAGADFEMRWLDRDKKEHESAEFLKLNPMGRVPVLEIGTQAIFESGAICTYLGDLFAEKGLAPLPNSPERAEYLQWMFLASSIDTYQIRIMVIEDIPPGEVQKAKEAALQAELRDTLVTLDRVFTEKSFLVGNRFTAADVSVSYHLYWLRLWPELDQIFNDFPKVKAYMDRMESHPSAIKADVFSYKS